MHQRFALPAFVRTTFALVACLAGCSPAPSPDVTIADAFDAVDAGTTVPDSTDTTDVPLGPTSVLMDFTHAGGFYTAPFPSEDRRLAGDRIDLHDFPNPRNIDIMNQLLAILRTDANGFGVSSDIYFQLSGPIDPNALPDVHGSLAPGSPVFLVGVESTAPDYLQRYPLSIAFERDGGPFGAPYFLELLPQQGIPLREHTLYAAVVLRSLTDPTGRPLDVNPSMAQLVAGMQPAGMPTAAFQSYQSALTALRAAHVDASQIAGLTVFRTGTPTAAMAAMRTDVLSRPMPTPDGSFVRDTSINYPGYCVYATTIHVPDYQGGVPPFNSEGGGWTYDSAGHPMVQRMEQASLYVTIPQSPMPTAGYPVMVLVRTGAGGDRPLMDRGMSTTPHAGTPVIPGSGPAMNFAHYGFAGAQIDGPLGGLRNTTHADEQFLVFNVQNPTALRDNVRESALELILFAHVLEGIQFNASDCMGVGGTGMVHFDVNTMGILGHSMGSTIAPLAIAFEPRFRAVILSGAGGSYIENVVYKQSPTPVRGIMEVLLHYSGTRRTLGEHDPALSILQWAGEPADPPAYARYIVREPLAGAAPRNVLMVQGIVDTYILPSIANSTSLSVGLDLGGMELDNHDARIATFTPLGTLLDLSGRHAITLPAQCNITPGCASTAVVVQALQDMYEDGHEVIFQTEGPKHQYGCFLQSFARGGPVVVPAPGMQFDPCP